MKNVSIESRPKVSVIVPIYNAELVIEKCIKSILNQEFEDFELILVDDGSKDTSVEICQRYSNQYSNVITVLHEINRGVSVARNTGLSNASGEWVAFVDADDAVSCDWLSGFYAYESKFDLITHPVVLIKDGISRSVCLKMKHEKDSLEQNIWELYKTHMFGFVWSMFFKKNIIDEHDLKFDYRLKGGEDLEFVSRYIKYVHCIDSFTIGYYIYTYPLRKNITYAIRSNVWFVVYHRIKGLLQGKILEEFTNEIAPQMVAYILSAYVNDIIVAKELRKYYCKCVNPPFFLKTKSKVGFIGNLMIRFDVSWLLKVMYYVLCKKEGSKIKFIYIDFDK